MVIFHLWKNNRLKPPYLVLFAKRILVQSVCNAIKTLKTYNEEPKSPKIAWIGVFSGILFMSRGLVAQEIKRFSGKPAGWFFDVEGFASNNTFL